MVRPARLERATFWFVAKRSIQLSYGREGGKEVKATNPYRLPRQPAPLQFSRYFLGMANLNNGTNPTGKTRRDIHQCSGAIETNASPAPNSAIIT